MAESTIQKFKSTLIGGGARPNLFEVRIPGSIPGGGVLDDDFSILCKASQLPASNIGMIDVPFRGRNFKVAGDRTFDEWSVTVINDESFRIRRTFEDWMNFIGQYGDASGATNPNSYMVSAYVKQLTRTPSNIRTTGENAGTGNGLNVAVPETIYKFHDIFPTSLSAIDLSYDSSNVIEEFTVSFQVQYWTPASKGEIGE
jgi:hypothetical protein